ncbi:hypothetical protein [Streptomyces sp. NPDC014791]|uniref:hypothetical protein n=1 Tax=Streptomyces sp. NPDC014791 TaxID=3364912 RepID=UPI0036FF1635
MDPVDAERHDVRPADIEHPGLGRVSGHVGNQGHAGLRETTGRSPVARVRSQEGQRAQQRIDDIAGLCGVEECARSKSGGLPPVCPRRTRLGFWSDRSGITVRDAPAPRRSAVGACLRVTAILWPPGSR